MIRSNHKSFAHVAHGLVFRIAMSIAVTGPLMVLLPGCPPPGPIPPPSGPVAVPIVQSLASVGTVVVLDGGASFDTNGNPIVEFLWSQVTGPPAILTSVTEPITTFIPELPGVYAFSLTVRNDLGETGVSTVTVNVTDELPLSTAAEAEDFDVHKEGL